MRKVAVYCMTRNIYHMVRPSLNSLLKNSGVDHVYLVAEDDDVGFTLPEKVSVINVADQKWFDPEGPNYHCKWTYMVMMRIVLCYLLPEEDRVLALDLDTIIDDNIDDIWKTPIDNFYFAACPEYRKSDEDRKYINGGVVLWNLKKMRDGMADKMVKELNTNYHEFCEQDVINMYVHDIYILNSMYNACRFTAPTPYPKIHHFPATGGWYTREPLMQKYKDYEE